MAAQEQPGLQVRRLPENININISASYGITLLNGAPPAARRFVDFVPSLDSQAVLARHGLAPR